MRTPRLLTTLLMALCVAGCGHADPVIEGQAASVWIRQLNDKDSAARNAAVEALSSGGQQVVGLLDRALWHTDDDIRRGAAAALIELGPPGRDVVRATLATGEPEVQFSLARVMFRTNFEAQRAVPVVMAKLAHRDPQVRHQAIHVLGDLTAESTSAVPALVEALSSSADDIRYRAACALVRIGPGAAEAVPHLTKALDDPDSRIRHAAVQALGAIGEPARSALPALTAALNDQEEEVRWRAGEVLKGWD